MKGVEKADSIVFNPHKWLGVVLTVRFILFATQSIWSV